MNHREVMQQALEALVEINKLSIGEHAICLPGEIDTAMDALRAALAEPEQEPVAWMYHGIRHDGTPHDRATLIWRPEYMDLMSANKGAKAVPLYTAPTPRKPLTDEELRECWDQVGNNETVWAMRVQFARAIEAAHGITGETK